MLLIGKTAFYLIQYKMSAKFGSSNRWKWMVASLNILERLTTKFELVFVLTQENAFSQRFHFKANRRSIGSSKK